MRYANNSNYKNDTMIRKEVQVSKTVLVELRRILEDSEVSLHYASSSSVVMPWLQISGRWYIADYQGKR